MFGEWTEHSASEDTCASGAEALFILPAFAALLNGLRKDSRVQSRLAESIRPGLKPVLILLALRGG